MFSLSSVTASQNAEMTKSAVKRGFISKAARQGDRITSLRTTSWKARGSGRSWIKNKEPGLGGEGGRGKVVRKGAVITALPQVFLSYRPLHVQKWRPSHYLRLEFSAL